MLFRSKAKITVTDRKTVTVLGHSREVFVLEGETTKLKCDANRKRSFTETWLYDAGLGAVVSYELKWVNSPVPDGNVKRFVSGRRLWGLPGLSFHM